MIFGLSATMHEDRVGSGSASPTFQQSSPLSSPQSSPPPSPNLRVVAPPPSPPTPSPVVLVEETVEHGAAPVRRRLPTQSEGADAAYVVKPGGTGGIGGVGVGVGNDGDGATLASPHGERLPEGATIASCTFLNPRASGSLLPELTPSHGGTVPRVLYLATLLDVTAVGLVVPLLATYSRALGAGPQFTGLLQATYGLSQLVGSNMLGGLSDTVGRRRLLQLSALGGMLGYSCLALSLPDGIAGPNGSLAMLLLSRLPIGLLKQSLTVARALVVDTTRPAERMRPMAALGGVTGIGFVIGPGVGGALSKKLGLHAPPMLAAALFMLAQLVVSLGLPETAPLPLAAAELRTLLATARARWEAAGKLPEAAAPSSSPHEAEVPLPVAVATELCAALIVEWRPNGEPLRAEERAPALELWKEALRTAPALELWKEALRTAPAAAEPAATKAAATTKAAESKAAETTKAAATTAAADPTTTPSRASVEWAVFADVLSARYAEHKVSHGMLHRESMASLLGRPAAGAAGAATGAAAAEAVSGLRKMLVAASGLWRSDSLPQVRVILMARALIELSVMMMHATFADYTRTKFGWDQKATGYGMALSGALSVVVDLGILPMLHRRRVLSELPTALGGGVLVAAGLALIALGSAVRAFLLGLAVLSLGTSLFKSALNTLVMGLARRDEAGTISGAVDAMEAVCRVAAPLGGGLLLEHVSIEGPACCGIVSALVGTWALYEVAPAAHKRALLAGKVYEEGKKRA
jgi:predicted MFS family arabinose efflux permease